MILNHWQMLESIAEMLVSVARMGGIAAIYLLGFATAAAIVVVAYTAMVDSNMMQKCTTLYERQAKAYAAADDYFGRRLRQTIADETKQCAEYAARKN
jgi:hypothetical protein